MNFLKSIYIDTFKLLRENLILAQPFVLYLLILAFLFVPLKQEFSIKNIILVAVTTTLVTAVFNAGWLNMMRSLAKTLPNPNLSSYDRMINSFRLFKEFLPGLEQHFFNILLGSIFCLCIVCGVFSSIISYGLAHYPLPAGFDVTKPFTEDYSYFEFQAFFMQLSVKWHLIIIICFIFSFFWNFMTFFWPQSVVFYSQGYIKALLNSAKQLFVHPVRSLIIYFSYGLILQIAGLMLALPCILGLIGFIVYILVITYFNLLLVVYFEKQESLNINRTDCFR